MLFKKHNPGCPCCLTGSDTGSYPYDDLCNCCVGSLPSGFNITVTTTSESIVLFNCGTAASINETKAMTEYPRAGSLCKRWAAAFSVTVCCDSLNSPSGYCYKTYALTVYVECRQDQGVRVSYIWSLGNLLCGDVVCIGDEVIVQDEADAICTADLEFDAPVGTAFDNCTGCTLEGDGVFVDDFHIVIAPA